MTEYIEREAALSECQNAIFVAIAQKHYFDEFCINLKQKITKMPAADVVEVVRCKDCKHATLLYSLGKYMCKKGCGATKVGDDFCSYGEKMDEGKGDF